MTPTRVRTPQEDGSAARCGAVEGRGPDMLVSGARTGDEAAWTRLYDLHAGRLLLWLQLPSTDAASTADDIAAQSWLTAASKIREFRGSDDDFGGWLFGIARGHALNHYRKGVRRRTRPGDVDEAAEPLFGGPLDDVGRADDRDSVRRLLAHLSPREAEVI